MDNFKRRLVIVATLYGFSLPACSIHEQLRTDFTSPESPLPGKHEEMFPEDDEKTAERSHEILKDRVFEPYRDDFLLAHVEFDDQGRFWESGLHENQNQLEALESWVQKDVADNPDRYQNGAIILAFAHGWRHNAEEGDGYLQDYRRLLATVAEDERNGQNRPVIGVYLSWRGAAVDEKAGFLTTVPAVFTYWNRKNTAHSVGNRSFGETLTRLHRLRNLVVKKGEGLNPNDQSVNTRAIIVGHSFGAAAVFSGVERYFEDQLIGDEFLDSAREKEMAEFEQWAKRRWDLVLLINPAFEALRYDTIHRYNRLIVQDPDSRIDRIPRLLVVTAENDMANKMALPAGQTLGSLFSRTQKPNSRFDEKAQLTTALGFFRPFQTHQLVLDGNSDAVLKILPDLGASIPPIRENRRTGMRVAKRERVQAFAAPEELRGDLDFLDPFARLMGDGDDGGTGPAEDRPSSGVRRKRAEVFPFMVALAQPEIVDSHNGIWGRQFREFVVRFVGAQDAAIRKLAGR